MPAAALPLIGLLAYGFKVNPRLIPSPLVDKPAPAFRLQRFDGGHLNLADLRGKPVFVNFWASWCPPCRQEARLLEAAWRRYKDQDVAFIGINVQDTEANARAFLREFGITYPNGMDPTNRAGIEYGVYGLPESFFIDRQGIIRYKHIGAIGDILLLANLDALAKGTALSRGTGAAGDEGYIKIR